MNAERFLKIKLICEPLADVNKQQNSTFYISMENDGVITTYVTVAKKLIRPLKV